jgi:hypothetical protein
MGDHKFNPFARGAQVPPPELEVRDAFGRVLHPGDTVALAKPSGMMPFRVAEIRPNLDPAAPPHSMRVTLLIHLPMTVRAGVPVAELVRVLTAAEAGLTVKDETKSEEKATEVLAE